MARYGTFSQIEAGHAQGVFWEAFRTALLVERQATITVWMLLAVVILGKSSPVLICECHQY
jgi:hypothetical protein